MPECSTLVAFTESMTSPPWLFSTLTILLVFAKELLASKLELFGIL